METTCLQSGTDQPRMLSHSPYSTPVGLSSPRSDACGHRCLQQENTHQDTNVRPPIFPLIVRTPRLPHGGGARTLNLDQVCCFNCFVGCLFNFPKVIPMDKSNRRMIVLTRHDGVSGIAIITINHIIRRLVQSSFQPCYFVYDQVVHTSRSRNYVVGVTKFMYPPIRRCFTTFDPLRGFEASNEHSSDQLNATASRFLRFPHDSPTTTSRRCFSFTRISRRQVRPTSSGHSLETL